MSALLLGPVDRSISLAPDLSEVARARRFVEAVATEAGFSDDRMFDILVVSSEATANAIEHAPQKGHVRVRTSLFSDRLEVHVEGPGEFQTPNRLKGGQSRGLGLPLMARLADHLALYSAPEGGTLVSLTFFRPGVHREQAGEPLPPSLRELVESSERTRDRLTRDQALLDAFFERARSPLVLLDTSFNFVRVNQAYAQACHRPIEDFAGRNHFDMYPSDTRVLFEEVVRAKRPMTVEARAFVFPDHPEWGVTYWDWTLTPILDVAGDVDALLFSLQEVTRSRRAKTDWAARLRWWAGERLVRRSSAVSTLALGTVVEVGLLYGLSALGPPSHYLGLPGSAAALIAVLAALVSGPVVGTVVALVAGAAYFVFITEAGASVLWPPIAATIILLALAAAVAGVAGDRIRSRAAVRETMLSQSVAERQRLHDELRDSYDQQRSVIERLESAFLEVPEAIAGVDSGHEYHSATKGVHIGGDFYDLVQVSDTSVAVLIGDVSGHGLDAARLATMVKDVVAALVLQKEASKDVLEQVNDLLVRRGVSGFVTAFLAQLDLGTGELEYSSAGHPPPFRSDGRQGVHRLAFPPCPPLGVFAEAEYRSATVRLHDSDLLFLYTDGLTEARNGDTFYGEERVRLALERWAEMPARDLPGLMSADALEFTHGYLQDDVALLALRYLGCRQESVRT